MRLKVLIWSDLLWEEVFRNYSSVRVLKPRHETVGLPDKDDEHVVALARQENVHDVVTFNLKGFPQAILNGFEIHCQHPDEFLCEEFRRTRKKSKRPCVNI